MKICIIGNSHVGALKRAWDELFDAEIKLKYELTFFAAKADGISDLELNGNVLAPNSDVIRRSIEFTSGGYGEIKLDNYDAFLIHGLVPSYFDSNVFYSISAIDRSLNDLYLDSIGYNIYSMITNVFKGPVYLGHPPLKSNEKLESLDYSENHSLLYSKGIDIVNKKYFGESCGKLIKQPACTMSVNQNCTLAKFTKGSTRLELNNKQGHSPHPKNENRHMNSTFGKLWLESFLSII